MRKTTEVETFYGFDFSKIHFPLVTVYYSPTDFEGKYVARLFDLGLPTEYAVVKDTLEEVREALQKVFLNCIKRDEKDDAVIVETWI